jgi:hypothetical protein
MTLTQKKRCGSEIQFDLCSRDSQESCDIVFPSFGQTDDLRIDQLFSRKSRLRHQPPNARMKPEQRRHDFFGYGDEPVPPSNVK